jgi:hypothetical protein
LLVSFESEIASQKSRVRNHQSDRYCFFAGAYAGKPTHLGVSEDWV